jgi:hypothetical protein
VVDGLLAEKLASPEEKSDEASPTSSIGSQEWNAARGGMLQPPRHGSSATGSIDLKLPPPGYLDIAVNFADG